MDHSAPFPAAVFLVGLASGWLLHSVLASPKPVVVVKEEQKTAAGKPKEPEQVQEDEDNEEDYETDDDEDEEEEVAGKEPASIPRGPYKMVLVVRTDLQMGKGKAAAQVKELSCSLSPLPHQLSSFFFLLSFS